MLGGNDGGLKEGRAGSGGRIKESFIGQGKVTRHGGDEGGEEGEGGDSGLGRASEAERKKAKKPLLDTLNLRCPKVIR